MKTSEAGIALIKQFEAFKPDVYKDIVGIPTVGFGHVVRPGEVFDHSLTEQEASDLMAVDLGPFEDAVNAVEASLSQNEFDACVSLAYNIGAKAFSNSTVVRRLENDDFPGAADAFLMWNKAGGKPVTGLTNRRAKERAMFLGNM